MLNNDPKGQNTTVLADSGDELHNDGIIEYVENNYADRDDRDQYEVIHRLCLLEKEMAAKCGDLILVHERKKGEPQQFFLGRIYDRNGFLFPDDDSPAQIRFPVRAPSYMYGDMTEPDRDPSQVLGEHGWKFNVLSVRNDPLKLKSLIPDHGTSIVIGEKEIVQYSEEWKRVDLIDEMIWFVTKDDE